MATSCNESRQPEFFKERTPQWDWHGNKVRWPPGRWARFYRDKLEFGLDVDGLTGSVQGLCLVVDDIAAVRDDLIDRGVGVSSIRHKDVDGGQWQGRFHLGADPQRADYASFADFSDPDGNIWVLQERGHRDA